MAQNPTPNILRLAAFSDNDTGGNPAGVMLADRLPSKTEMLAIAADIGYSETAFAAPVTGKNTHLPDNHWQVRYFAPKIEVPFCGHATIAITAALAEQTGQDHFTLHLADTTITTQATKKAGRISASFLSPRTSSRPADSQMIAAFCRLFGWDKAMLDSRYPPVCIHAGAWHFLLVLNHRSDLAAMQYDFEQGAQLMTRNGMVTIMLVWQEKPEIFHVRNAFAAGGIVEDPATGAAAAAFTGYLQKTGQLASQTLTFIQGEDMGMRSILTTRPGRKTVDSVEVSGYVRAI